MLKTVGLPSTRTGDQTIVNGNLVIGTSGKGIDFSATAHPAGMSSEILNDYEQGTWTPGFAAWSTAPTFSDARYIKIGSQVTVILLAQNGVNAGNQAITGLPYTNSNAVSPAGAAKPIGAAAAGTLCTVDTNVAAIGSFDAVNFTGRYWALCITYCITF